MRVIKGFATLLTAASLTSVTLLGLGSAQAQGWLWGGDTIAGGSGRTSVNFSQQFAPGQIIVSFTDRRLYLVTQRGHALSYPIAVPREQSRWQGTTSVSMKRVNPSWTPTPTMRRENPRLPNWVPGGHPLNPLGVRALYLGSSAYRIHGTDAPWTIGSAVSKGCIRMYNQDVVDLYPRVPVGTKVLVTWNSYKGGGYASAAPPPSERAERHRVPRAAQYRSSRRAAATHDNEKPRMVSKETADAADEAQPRRKFSSAKRIVAKKKAPKVSSATNLE
ncbi:MAG: L,D-transpeptidase [Hyphomicrobiaceae bacterium]